MDGHHEPPRANDARVRVDKIESSVTIKVFFTVIQNNMSMKMIPGGRDQLEKQLAALVLTPGPLPSEFDEILERLDKKAKLTVVSKVSTQEQKALNEQ